MSGQRLPFLHFSTRVMRRSLLALSSGTLLAGLIVLGGVLTDGSQRAEAGFVVLVLGLAFVAAMFVISVVALGRLASASLQRSVPRAIGPGR